MPLLKQVSQWLVQIFMIILAAISALLSNHVDLDTTVGDDRNDEGIDSSEILNALYSQIWINPTLLNGFDKQAVPQG
ncbi:hypothetical protein N7462_009678 [Penicillium macrosclerotiorum]|uniref:uncharacterized protein n=1 Tax=Penicillium macrosclerotiorum TaxID=303699 RepID=UPI002548EAD3|nr:uncharacterized protein N7462_009678 [Penicillium macrosclerotiorum]KAJ5674239.1 hypothetical protein N7462_009678 [Penicillium macrosclerotiorum]